MKRSAQVLFFVTIACVAYAQNPTNKIVLAKNQQIKFTSSVKGSISQEMMGQSMESIMDINGTRSVTVKDIIAGDYQLDAVTTHVSMNMSMMGQEKKFDSDNKDDMAGEMKDVGKEVNVVKKFTLSANGKCKADEKDTVAKSNDTGMPDMMQQMFGAGIGASTTESYFMLIPEGKKIGDSWTDSVAIGTAKTLWNYTWDSNSGDIAFIKATAKATSSKTINTQGMEIVINAVTDITETRKLDLKTGVLLNKVSITKLNGTAEVMGQSVPMTGTTTTTVTAE